jgi:dihydrofolate reductase
MRKLILSLHVTPDGFCNHQDGVVGEDWMRFISDLTEQTDTALFGRVTYTLFEQYWPQAARDRNGSAEMIRFADLIDGMNKVVYSRSMQQPGWRNTAVISNLSKESVDELKRLPGKDIIVFGGPGLVSQLIAMDAIEEYYIAVQPVLSGAGYRLFTEPQRARMPLSLVETISFESGVLLLHYRPAIRK